MGKKCRKTTRAAHFRGSTLQCLRASACVPSRWKVLSGEFRRRPTVLAIKFRKPDRVGRRGLSEPREDFSRLLTYSFSRLCQSHSNLRVQPLKNSAEDCLSPAGSCHGCPLCISSARIRSSLLANQIRIVVRNKHNNHRLTHRSSMCIKRRLFSICIHRRFHNQLCSSFQRKRRIKHPRLA